MQVSNPSSFGQWLRQSRKGLDLTQAELALRAGCSKGTIRKLESGELRPSKQLAEILAEQLVIAPDERAAFVRFARAEGLSAEPDLPVHVYAPAPWHPPSRPKTNLPIALTSFVGRAQERASVTRLLASTRLLTLTGAGGIGKTRLALQVAGEVAADASTGSVFSDGVWLVEFAQLLDPTLVPQTIALALGVSEQSGRPLVNTLADALRAKAPLLLLDNCEHLLQAIAVVAETLLQACPRLKVLATSREPLGIPGEVTFTVPPLSTPGTLMLGSAPNLQPEAVQLFVDRARTVQPDFQVNAVTAPLIANICIRLDGIPLAIELAAARLRSLSLEQIVSHLDDRFQLLTTGPRTALPRQQTLRATIDWGYDLLPTDGRILFRRLAVFAGGFTLEAAERICAAEPLKPSDALDLLARLVDQSLVNPNQEHQAQRYRMLETIRQYAHERLMDSAEMERVRDRHLDYFLELAQSAELELRGSAQVSWWNRLEAEHDNLRVALNWCASAESKGESGLRLAGALARFWETRDYLSEGRERLAAALAHPVAQARTRARAKALAGAGLLAWKQGYYSVSRSFYEASLSIYRELDHKRGIAAALNGLGDASAALGAHKNAGLFFEQALSLWREVQDSWGGAGCLMDLGWCAVRLGNCELATERFAEALRYFRLTGDRNRSALALSGLGEAALRQGDYAKAGELLGESLSLSQELGNRFNLAATLGTLGWVAMRQGRFTQAREWLCQSVRIRHEIGETGGMAWCLEKLAALALATQERERAARIFAAAAALRAANRSTIDPTDQPEYERNLAQLEATMGSEDYAEQWAQGKAMTLEQAIAYALGEEP